MPMWRKKSPHTCWNGYIGVSGVVEGMAGWDGAMPLQMVHLSLVLECVIGNLDVFHPRGVLETAAHMAVECHPLTVGQWICLPGVMMGFLGCCMGSQRWVL